MPTTNGPLLAMSRRRPDDGAARLTTVLVGALALFFLGTLGATTASFLALQGLRDDVRVMASRGPDPVAATSTVPAQPTDGATDQPVPTAGGTSAAGTDQPAINPTSDFSVKYQNKQLTLTPNGYCSYGRPLDLDDPKVGVENGSDVTYSPSCTAQPAFSFKTDKVARLAPAEASPQDCMEKIDLAPAPQSVELNEDLVLCAVTDGQGSAADATRSKVVRIVVNSVKSDQTVTVTLTAWEVPS